MAPKKSKPSMLTVTVPGYISAVGDLGMGIRHIGSGKVIGVEIEGPKGNIFTVSGLSPDTCRLLAGFLRGKITLTLAAVGKSEMRK